MVARIKTNQTVGPKILLNVGAGLDIPTGAPVTGRKGETIINGGIGTLNGIVATGNKFKSSFLHYLSLQSLNRLLSTTESTIATYDTEVNMQIDSLPRLLTDMEYINKYLESKPLFDDNYDNGLWSITNIIEYYGDQWFELFKDYYNEKMKDKKSYIEYKPFTNIDGSPLIIPAPTIQEIDSLTAFETSESAKVKDNNLLGSSETNTVHMRQGLAKTNLFSQMRRFVNAGYIYTLMTGQEGDKLNIGQAPNSPPPKNKLGGLKGSIIKGVSDQFYYSLHNCWHISKSTPLIDTLTKKSKYPYSRDTQDLDNELFLLTINMLRAKSGPSDYIQYIVVSQTDGVQEPLTNFYNIKNHTVGNTTYGFSGNNTTYHLDLLPEVNMTRMTVRTKIREVPLLARALSITNELLQMERFWGRYLHTYDLKCSPAELYKDLTAMGYNMNELLATRGWHSPDQYTHPVPFLSAIDLLRMRKGLYRPYWMK